MVLLRYGQILFFLMIMVTPNFGFTAEKKKENAKPTVSFERNVRPIFEKHCWKCHGPKKQSSGLRLDKRALLIRGGDSGEPAIVIGKNAKSYLIQLVTSKEQSEVMPPKGPRLSPAEVAVLREWIDQGAKWPGQENGTEPDNSAALKHWSFIPVKRPVIPQVKQRNWLENSIDAFVLSKLERAKLTPSRRANRNVLLRRLSLVIRGIPPTPTEVSEFVKDNRVDAFSRWVNRFLADPKYGERWAAHWLDIARFAETTGFETNVPRPHAWRYRDYVIRAFNSDLPYNSFVREQLAGDVLGAGVATGFLVAGPYDRVKSPDINLTLAQRQNELHDMINVTSSAFLGLTVGCARCHNHKFDPVLQRDYYAFQAVFAGVNHGDRNVLAAANPEQKQHIAQLREKLQRNQQQLAKFEQAAVPNSTGRTIVIDDESLSSNDQQPGVKLLATKRGHGVNPPGASRGFRNDLGGFVRLPNISQGQYTWWNAKPNANLMSYRPRAKGRFQIWLSWGCGMKTHATDVSYLLDRDGDPATRSDQKLLARVNQQQFAGGVKTPQGKPLWSGLHFAGLHELTANSCILVRNGTTARPVTADVIVLEEVTNNSKNNQGRPPLPRLRDPVNARQNVERFPAIMAQYIRFNILATNASEPCLDELEVWTADGSFRNVALTTAGGRATSSGNYPGNGKHKLTHINDGQFGNSRSWISNTAGTGWIQIRLSKPVRIDRIVWGRDRQGTYADRLATKYRIDVAMEPTKWQTVARSESRLPVGMKIGNLAAYRFANLSQKDSTRALKLSEENSLIERQLTELTKPVLVYAGNFKQPGPTHRLYRGDPLAKREVVSPGAVTALGRPLGLNEKSSEKSRRVALANWIVDRRNPLTARVMVNRLWQHHFGRGLVSTPSDFGKMGVLPSHPQLLDWLADEFIRSGWSVKHLQRLILNSNTWQQSSLPNSQALQHDAGTLLIWRFPPRRLAAEAIRDSILTLSESLDDRMAGPGFSAFQLNTNYVRVYNPKTEWTSRDWRRMIYMTKVRMERDAVFGAFDCPDAGQATAARARSTTPLQALSLLNSSFILQQAERTSQSLLREAGPLIERQITLLYRRAYSRQPSAIEIQDAKAFVKQFGLRALSRAVLNSNEFLFLQ
jgi:hypothetical protein